MIRRAVLLAPILLAGCVRPDLPAAPGACWRNGLGMTFVRVPAGEFAMGTTASEAKALLERFAASGLRQERLAPEQPQHGVAITRAFLMGKHEVTIGQFRRFVEATGYTTDAERRGGAHVFDAAGSQDWFKKAGAHWRTPGFPQTDRHPVVCVSWNDAQAFIEWLNEADPAKPKGGHYRLPTEAEWEYAARGSEGLEYAWGDEWDGERANFADARSSVPWADEADDEYSRTAPVGSYSPAGDTPLGIADLTGNVWEWCLDTFAADFYQRSPRSDPVCLEQRPERVERGGSWGFTPDYCRAAFRFHCAPAESYDTLGFRVLLVPQ